MGKKLAILLSLLGTYHLYAANFDAGMALEINWQLISTTSSAVTTTACAGCGGTYTETQTITYKYKRCSNWCNGWVDPQLEGDKKPLGIFNTIPSVEFEFIEACFTIPEVPASICDQNSCPEYCCHFLPDVFPITCDESKDKCHRNCLEKDLTIGGTISSGFFKFLKLGVESIQDVAINDRCALSTGNSQMQGTTQLMCHNVAAGPPSIVYEASCYELTNSSTHTPIKSAATIITDTKASLSGSVTEVSSTLGGANNIMGTAIHGDNYNFKFEFELKVVKTFNCPACPCCDSAGGPADCVGSCP